MPRVITQRKLEIKFTALEEITEIADDTTEPYNVIQGKIKDLTDILGVTEEEAERIVLGTQKF